jgi:uncharacterized protein YukE
MPQAIVTPEELERFAGSLRQFNGQLRDTTSRLVGQFNQLGDTWRDQEQQKFARQFEETMISLRRFMQAADEQIPFLLRKAEAARAYLERR